MNVKGLEIIHFYRGKKHQELILLCVSITVLFKSSPFFLFFLYSYVLLIILILRPCVLPRLLKLYVALNPSI